MMLWLLTVFLQSWGEWTGCEDLYRRRSSAILKLAGPVTTYIDTAHIQDLNFYLIEQTT